MEEKNLWFKFLFSQENVITCDVEIDLKTKLRVNQAPIPKVYQSFTDLEYQKCSNCPLNNKNFPDCSVAMNLAEIVDGLKKFSSFEKKSVSVEG